MFRIVALILVQLHAPYIAIISDVSIPYAYADSDGDSDSDDREDSDDSDDSDDSNSESETENPSGGNTSGGSNNSGNTEDGAKGADDANSEGNNTGKKSTRIKQPNASSHNGDSRRSHQRFIRKAVQQKQILPLGKFKRFIEKQTVKKHGSKEMLRNTVLLFWIWVCREWMGCQS